MKINILKYILVLVPEVPQGRPPKVQRACGLLNLTKNKMSYAGDYTAWVLPTGIVS